VPAARHRSTFVDRLILSATELVHRRLCGPDRAGKYSTSDVSDDHQQSTMAAVVTAINAISIYKGIGNSAISSTAANRIVARLYT